MGERAQRGSELEPRFPIEKPPHMLPVGEHNWNQLSGEQFGKIFFKVLKICLLFDPVIPLLRICPKEVIQHVEM